MLFLNNTQKGKMSLEEAKKYLKDIRKGNKNAEQKKFLANINLLFNAINIAIEFIEDYGSMILEAKRLLKKKEQDLKY